MEEVAVKAVFSVYGLDKSNAKKKFLYKTSQIKDYFLSETTSQHLKV